MSIKKRRRLRYKKSEKRRKRRAKLKATGKNPDDFFSSGIYLGRDSI